MGRATHWAVMIFTPTEMCDLGCVDRTAQESVAEESVCRISAWCAGSETGFKVAPNFQPLEETVPTGSALPQDPLNIAQGGGQEAVLVMDVVSAILNDPLGGYVSGYSVVAKKGAKELDGP